MIKDESFLRKYFKRLVHKNRGDKIMLKKHRAQSFVEFALVLPILLLILLGVVELTLFIGSYINIVDMTREAARFASNRDPFSPPGTQTCRLSISKAFDFFYDTSCIFSPMETGCTFHQICSILLKGA